MMTFCESATTKSVVKFYKRRRFYRWVMPYTLPVLQKYISEINYDARLNPWNHGPHWMSRICAFVDCYPLVVWRPRDPTMFDNLNQGKYSQTILKAQVACTFLGDIVLSTGLHGGLPCDTEVWRSTADRHPLLTGEWWLGDGIYIAEHGLLAKKKKPHHRNLTTFELLYNARIDHYRARAEHIIAHIKTHGFFRTACRLEKPQIEGIWKILVHATALRIRQFGPLYQGYGPQYHFPEGTASRAYQKHVIDNELYK